MLRDVVTRDNTASDVWADTAYRSQANEVWLKSMGRVSRVHRKKPRGKPMSKRTSGANAKRSAVRARVEHVFARQKDQMGLFVRTIGIARAEPPRDNCVRRRRLLAGSPQNHASKLPSPRRARSSAPQSAPRGTLMWAPSSFLMIHHKAGKLSLKPEEKTGRTSQPINHQPSQQWMESTPNGNNQARRQT